MVIGFADRFFSQEEWGRWLAENHGTSNGIWLKFYKKASGVKSLHYDEALDEALCSGGLMVKCVTGYFSYSIIEISD